MLQSPEDALKPYGKAEKYKSSLLRKPPMT